MAVTHKLAVIINNPLNDVEFLLTKQTPPPKFSDPEYDSYVDSDLWDLPSTQLNPLQGQSNNQLVVQDDNLCSHKLNFSQFDLNSALSLIFEQVGFGTPSAVQWKFLKCVEEPEFGPGLPVTMLYIVGNLGPEDGNLGEVCKWMCIQSCLNCLIKVKPSSDRVGPLVVSGLLNDSIQSDKWKIPPTLHFQEYPPGIKLVPMGSRTQKPFHTTNLVVFAPENNHDDSGDNSYVAHGDALIIDPGCRSEFNKELMEIVAALPRKLVVFLTHHHRDHVDGLSIVQKSNPDASLITHENTMRRIQKDDWSLGYTSVSGAEEICIGGQRLRVIFSPGHTDGHMALLHVSTQSLIVGDHCVGQGSAALDISSGGNMSEYFQTCYKLMELSPHTLIPMHGRVNLWPKHMLCGYIKNRRNREASILKAIEEGAKTLFDIVAHTYSAVDRSLWISAASNVRLHVDHLAQQDRLPKGYATLLDFPENFAIPLSLIYPVFYLKAFSIKKFQTTCGIHFVSRWMWAFLSSRFPFKHHKHGMAKLLSAVAVAGFAVLYSVRKKLTSG